MGRKKRTQVKFKPFCYYCDREFDDINVLRHHQNTRHFACPVCGKRFSTAFSMSTHAVQVHKETVPRVPNAKAGRDSLDLSIYGMEGVPPDVIAAKYNEKLGSAKRMKADLIIDPSNVNNSLMGDSMGGEGEGMPATSFINNQVFITGMQESAIKHMVAATPGAGAYGSDPRAILGGNTNIGLGIAPNILGPPKAVAYPPPPPMPPAPPNIEFNKKNLYENPPPAYPPPPMNNEGIPPPPPGGFAQIPGVPTEVVSVVYGQDPNATGVYNASSNTHYPYQSSSSFGQPPVIAGATGLMREILPEAFLEPLKKGNNLIIFPHELSIQSLQQINSENNFRYNNPNILQMIKDYLIYRK